MNNQFTDFTVPDPNKLYYYSELCETSGFTLLMKLTLMVNDYPDAFDMIQKIVDVNPAEIYKQARNGMNVLMIAASNCSRLSLIDCIKLYIDKCLDKNILLNATDNEGSTALVYACKEYYYPRNEYFLYRTCSNFSYECIELLLTSGADVNLYLYDADNALEAVCRCKNHDRYIDCIKLLLSHGAKGDSALLNVIQYGYPHGSTVYDACKILIESGVKNHYIYKKNKKYIGNSSILKLCRYVHNEHKVKFLDLLINCGADPNMLKCSNYNNALIVASKYITSDTPVEFVDRLINLTTNLDLQNYKNNTALITLCKSISIFKTEHTIVTKESIFKTKRTIVTKESILETLKQVKHIDEFKKKLKVTVIPTNSKYVNLFLKAGANVDLYNYKSYTALMYYCKFTFFTVEDVDTLILFIKSSTNIKFKNKKGKTAYNYFINNSSHRIIINDYIKNLLKGKEIIYNNIKSARK